MKTKEELKEIKEEVEALNKKLAELTEEELAQVSGGAAGGVKLFSFEKGFGFIDAEQVRISTYYLLSGDESK